MELFDILNVDGSKTGIQKERKLVHEDGDIHASVHIWAYRIDKRSKEIEVLLQKRSKEKDSFPGRFDAASTGHVDAGEDFEDAAVREVFEEIGISIDKKHLHYIGEQKFNNDEYFHGKHFVNNEINRIYLIDESIALNDIHFDESEVSGVEWQNINEMLDQIKEGNDIYCTDFSEVLKVWSFIINRI